MSSTPLGAARCRRAPAARRDPTPARMDGAAGRQPLAQADGHGLRFGLGAADTTSVMDTPVLAIVLGVMGVTVGWWLLTAGPLGVRRQRRKARLQRRNEFFEHQYARRREARTDSE